MVGATVVPTQNYVNLEIIVWTAPGYLDGRFALFMNFYFEP